ncbi:hypothetical protein [Moraxella canis]|uniref:hypothetical protein n=1 Tax=Moraxella canis TaxID=90239 RepID=UPI001F169EED|nr:hypothetical protein [Moraxella canis]
MARKRGLGVKYGLDALLSGTKVGRQVVDVIDDAKLVMAGEDNSADQSQVASVTAEPDTAHDADVSKVSESATHDTHEIALQDDSADQLDSYHHRADDKLELVDESVLLEASGQADPIPQDTDEPTGSDDKAVASGLDNLPEYQQTQIALFWQFGLAEPR